MELSKGMAIFIIAFMVFSTVAFVLYASNNTDQQPATVPPISTDSATKLTFTANLDANVVEVFPSFKMMAETKEFDIAKIDSAIAQIDGIANVKSIFRQLPDQQGTGTINYYSADVSFDPKKTSLETITASIQEKTALFLSGHGFFPNALIIVPKKVLLEKTDLNLSKEYEFSDNLIQSYVNAGTIKGDSISVHLEIAFSGDQILGASSYELSNYSSEEKQHIVTLQFPIASLEQKLTFSADANYSDRLSKEAITAELLKIKDINNADVSAQPLANQMLVTIKKQDNNSFESDFNSALFSIPEISETEFFPDENNLNAIVSFSEQPTLTSLKQSITAKLLGLNVQSKDFSFTESTASFSGEITFNSADAKPVAEAVKEFFFAKKFSSKVYQNSLLKAEILFDSETKESFVVDSNSIDALIFPVHKIGDTLFVSVVFYTQRGKLLQAAAREEINPTRIG